MTTRNFRSVAIAVVLLLGYASSSRAASAALVSLTTHPPSFSVPVGTSEQFSATGNYSDGTHRDLTRSVLWTSDAPAAATISRSGNATGKAEGNVVIHAALAGVSTQTTITVTAPVLRELRVAPALSSVTVGNAQQFTATGIYSDGTTRNISTSVRWASANQTVAAINAQGLAIGSAIGVSTITAGFGPMSGSATLFVTPAALGLVSISVRPSNASTPLGTTQQFTATGKYIDGSTEDITSRVSWASTSPSVATINPAGLAKTVSQGGTTITASLGRVVGYVGFSVTPPILKSISVTPGTPSISLGETQQFNALGTFSDGSTQYLTSSARWTTSSFTVATVGAGGLARSVGQGTTIITATSAGVTGSATLSVTSASLVSLAIAPSNPSIALGSSQQFKATGTYTDGSTQDLTGSAAWSSSAGNVATIANGGVAASLGAGNSTISASVGTVSGSTRLTVTAPSLVSIAVTPAIPSIPAGEKQQFTATGTYTDQSTHDLTAQVQWTSSAMGTASISDDSGTFGSATGVAPGTTTITASLNSISGSTTLTVTSAVLVSISVTPGNPAIALGTSQQFSASGTYTDNSTRDLTTTASWSSASAAVAAVDNNGLASTAGTGTTVITATSAGVSGTATLTVNPAALVSIVVTTTNPSIPVGTTAQFSATGTYTDNSTQNLTASVHWSTDTPAVATISNASGSQGLVSALAPGSVNVQASMNSINSSATLNVMPAALVSISITPTKSAILLGASQQFSAVGTYTDGSMPDITSSVNWSSSDATIAVMDATHPGNAVSSGSGIASIKASLGAVTGTTQLTVVGPITGLTASPGQTNALFTWNQLPGLTYEVNQDQTGYAPASSPFSISGLAEGIHTIGLEAVAGGITGTPSTVTFACAYDASTGSFPCFNAVVSTPSGGPQLTAINVTPTAVSAVVGSTCVQIHATGVYTDGSSTDISGQVTWAAFEPYQPISAAGLLCPEQAGTSAITAALGTIQGGASATILSPPLPQVTAISAVPTDSSVTLTWTTNVAATSAVNWGVGTDTSHYIPDNGIFTTSHSVVISAISHNTIYSFYASGHDQYGNAYQSSTVMVRTLLLTSVTVIPANLTLNAGASQQFTAIGNYNDGSTRDLTSAASWNISDQSVGTMSATTPGLVLSTATGGVATVTAAVGSVQGSTTLTVLGPG